MHSVARMLPAPGMFSTRTCVSFRHLACDSPPNDVGDFISVDDFGGEGYGSDGGVTSVSKTGLFA
jgi:hypothetical protein